MNKKIAIAAALLATAAGFLYTKLIMSEVAIMEMFPELDQKIVIQAHRTMVLRAFSGMYSEVDVENEEIWKKTFLDIVAELQK